MARTSTHPFPTMRILVVEDEPASRDILTQILETKVSWQTTVVDNGAAGWWHLSDPDEDPYDMMITDLDMPIVGGLDLVKRIRKSRVHSNMLIVVCSGNKDRDVVKELVVNGTNGYILKPYEAKDVLAKIEGLLGNRPHRSISVALGAGGD